eukprot:gnl/TRDRNA2_/TRDRNA2_164471_c1_seq1.p1 gnl/TRDRNA2_/TRDRNA2_164471_c1~~gnl/TRDRNA2_/TRDRNA2_164471_c1_seq1.p1  ORF type:complete len:266 (-),score=22.05 gnl/TRDRNA2_/TRDRNA2_164471_c1_seq1:475-1164(-)
MSPAGGTQHFMLADDSDADSYRTPSHCGDWLQSPNSGNGCDDAGVAACVHDRIAPVENLDMNSLLGVLAEVQADPRHSHPRWRAVLRAVVVMQRCWRGDGIAEAHRAAIDFVPSEARWRVKTRELLSLVRTADPRHADVFLPDVEAQLIAARVSTIAGLAAFPLRSIVGTPGTRAFVRSAIQAAQTALSAAQCSAVMLTASGQVAPTDAHSQDLHSHAAASIDAAWRCR